MTCRERLRIEHPEKTGENFVAGCLACPHNYGYAQRPDGDFECNPKSCNKCWDRECDPDDTIESEDENMTTEQKREALREFCDSYPDCNDCPMDGNSFCKTYVRRSASPDVIDDWHNYFFRKIADPAPEKPTEKCDPPAGEDTNVPTRATILDAAKAIVCDGRPQEYGGPEDSFGRIAELWTAYTKCDLDAHDVAMMMALLKIARTKGGKYNRDNYVDLAGYAACAGEIGGKG